MKVDEIKTLAERQPFRPFTIRLTNGAQYTFNEPRDLGATKNYHVVFFFGPAGDWVLIDTESIVQVIVR